MSKSGATSTLELYSAATPNGIKVAACLEELVARKGEQISYDPYPINLRKAENRSEAFGQLNPNKKIPVLVDPCGVSGERTIVFESGAELLYLAEKYNELIPTNGTQRAELLSWLFWGSTILSTQVKLFGFYYKHCPHAIPYCVNRYTKEVNRLLDVLNSHLHDGRQYVMGGRFTVGTSFLDLSTVSLPLLL